MNEALLALAGILGAAVHKLASMIQERRRGNGLTVEDRVKALEERVHRHGNETHALKERVSVTEANVTNLKENVERIADAMERMDSKLDQALRRR